MSGSPTDAEILGLPLEGEDAPGVVLPEASTPESSPPVLLPSVPLADAAVAEDLTVPAEDVEAPAQVSELPPESAISDRDAFTDTYDLGDGMHLTRSSPEPINVRHEGEWTPIQTGVCPTVCVSESA